MQLSLADFGVIPEAEKEEIDILPVQTNVKSEFGDLFKLGNHYLLCGDSTNFKAVKSLLGDNKIDLVLTDPPYGIDIVGKDERIGKSKFYKQVKGDTDTKTAFEFFKVCQMLYVENYIIFGGNYFTDFLLPSRCWLIWDKQNGTTDFADFEMVWTSFNKPSRLYRHLWNGCCRAGDSRSEGRKRVHPTQKPVNLLEKILSKFSEENQNIFDGFGGSGSTLIACEKTRRNCFMIEYENFYIDIIISRWENFTGQKAELVGKLDF